MSKLVKVRVPDSADKVEEMDLDVFGDELVELGPKSNRVYFFKHDSYNVVKVGGRYYRKQSPLITKLTNGRYALRANVVITESGQKLDRTDENTVRVGNSYTTRNYVVTVNNEMYLKSDPSIVKNAMGGYMFKSDAVQINPAIYGANKFVKSDQTATTIKDEVILTNDSYPFIDRDGTVGIIYRNALGRTGFEHQIHFEFENKERPDAQRIKSAAVSSDTYRHHTIEISDPRVGTFRVHREHAEQFRECLDKYITITYKPSIDKLRAVIDSNYSDRGDDENKAKLLSKEGRRFGGGQVIAKSAKEIAIGDTTTLTGGLGYTFGVEVETAAGLVPKKIIQEVMDVDAVGDRSVGSAEYVTGILHGDAGMKKLENIMKVLQDHTLVDDECSVHIHVGTFDDKRVTPLTMDVELARKMIKLGAAIEKELFLSLPPSRKTNMKYCHGIGAYAGINEKNWKDYLGCFIFGNREDSSKGENMSYYKFGQDGRTENATLSKYHTGGRYKWLNLVHCVTRSYVRTVELRAFSGTTNFDKVKQFVLLSLALVDYANNHTLSQIKKTVTLSDVIDASIKDTETRDSMKKFLAERTAKFNRKRTY